MAITALTLNKSEKGFEVSFTATNGKAYKAELVENKYGIYMLEHDGVVAMYKMTGIINIFNGGISRADELEIQTKIIHNEFDGEPTCLAYCIYGGYFVASNNRIYYGQKPLIQLDADGKGSYTATWLGEGEVLFSDLMEASILVRVRSNPAKAWREKNGINA